MKRRQSIWMGICSSIGLMVLILDGKTAITGAKEGLQLCLNTLIPTLLPFFFLSNLLTASLIGTNIPLLNPLARLYRIGKGTEYILLTGFLGGYPLGAQCIHEAYRQGAISAREGRRMLAFCNNCGPAFLFGMAGALFQDPKIPWLLFGIHIASALIVSLVIPDGSVSHKTMVSPSACPVQALWKAIRAMAGVCGWVILFRTALAVMEKWIIRYYQKEIQVIFTGILELSNGCIALGDLENMPLKFILCSVFVAFGGLCVIMQTYSAAASLDCCLYFPGKITQAAVSMTLACLLYAPKWATIPAAAAIIAGIFLRKKEIRCRNSEKLVV